MTPPATLERLARELAAHGVIRWVLQPFRATGCTNEMLVTAAPEGAQLDAAQLARLRAHIPEIEVRSTSSAESQQD